MACTSRMLSHICCPKACCKALISQQRDGVLEFHFGSGRKYNLFPTHGACLHGRIMRSVPSPMTTVSWCSATEMAVWAIKTSASPGACTTGMPCCWNTVQRRLINLCLLAWFDRNLSFMTVQTMSGLKCTVGPIAPLPHRFCVPCLVVGPDSYPSIMIGFCICYAHSDPLELQCPARISLFPSIYGAIVLLHQVHEQLLQEHQHHGWRSISTLRLLGLACQLQEVYPRYGRGLGDNYTVHTWRLHVALHSYCQLWQGIETAVGCLCLLSSCPLVLEMFCALWWLGLFSWTHIAGHSDLPCLLGFCCRHTAILAFTPSAAHTPVSMPRRVDAVEKGWWEVRKAMSFSVSMTSHSCLALEMSSCWSLVKNSMNSCMATLTAEHDGLESSHRIIWISDMPRPCVSPPLVFRFLINTCSMTVSVESPAQNLLDHWTTYNPSVNTIRDASGCDASGWNTVVAVVRSPRTVVLPLWSIMEAAVAESALTGSPNTCCWFGDKWGMWKHISDKSVFRAAATS